MSQKKKVNGWLKMLKIKFKKSGMIGNIGIFLDRECRNVQKGEYQASVYAGAQILC